jgi:midasin
MLCRVRCCRQIWVPAISDEEELLAILESRLANRAMRNTIGQHLLAFWHLFVSQAPAAARGGLSVRDLLAWVEFINTTEPQVGALQAYAHGAYLTLLDGLGLGLGIPAVLLEPLKAKCRQLLLQQLSSSSIQPLDNASTSQQQLTAQQAAAVVAQAAGERILTVTSSSGGITAEQGVAGTDSVDVETSDGRWGIPPFFVVRGPQGATGQSADGARFNFQAPTTCRNAFRLLRAMQVRLPVT